MPKAAAVQLESVPGSLERAQGGDLEAFGALVSEHQGMVFSLAVHFVRDRAVAEELAQDVFVNLYENLGSLESEAHLTFWLRRVTSHRCIDWQRQATRRREVAMDERMPEPSAAPFVRDYLREERLRRLVADLPSAARLVVILRYQEDLQPLVIAEVLGMPLNTVKSHLRRSLAVLRERFEEEERDA
jgi:RNA polymerase sigma-70 factor (ECF subfamily)